MNGSMVIYTPGNGPMTTTMVCSNCPLIIYGKDFGVNLICSPFSQLDVILEMIWLESNHVHINYFNKSVLFHELNEEEDLRFIFANQVEELLKYEAQVFAMFASLKVETKIVIVDLSVVCKFSNVFL